VPLIYGRQNDVNFLHCDQVKSYSTQVLMSAWFEVEDEKNSNVYVTGLPEDITIEEFKEFMTKVGVIAYDPIYRKPKVKLYANPDGTYKGDGRCCYIKVRRLTHCGNITENWSKFSFQM